MQNEMLMDDSPKNEEEKNYNTWELSGEDNAGENAETTKNSERQNGSSSNEKPKNKNSAAKAVSHARSAVGNTNPNIRTGLSDDLNGTGTNVAYTERED